MKKHSVLVLSLLTAIVGCGSSDNPAPAPGTAGSAGSAGSAGHAGAVVSAGSGGMSATAGNAGTATSGGSAGTVAGSGGTCEIPSLEVFSRSDTAASWDDNDFSDVMLGADPCPKLVDVTWPHEAGWENADPSDANHEVTHFTLDSYSSVDLSNKKLSLTIELSSDQRGPAATAGSYSISLVSVSTFDRVVMPPSGAGADAGGASGSSGSAGASGSAGGGGASGGGGTSGGGGDSTGGTGGAMVTTETGYTEAESPVADRATLRFVGDRATVIFPLPAKTAEVGSYDPARAIKINIRIYNAFSNGQTMGMGGAGAGGGAGTGGSAGMSGSAGTAGKAGAGGSAGVGGTSGGSGGASGGSGGASGGSGGASGGSGGASGPAPTYDYVKSQFSIKSFVIKDASAP